MITIRVTYGLVKGFNVLKKEEEMAKNWKPEQIPFNDLKQSIKNKVLELNNINSNEERQTFEAQMMLRSFESNNISVYSAMDSIIESKQRAGEKHIDLPDSTREELRKLFEDGK